MIKLGGKKLSSQLVSLYSTCLGHICPLSSLLNFPSKYFTKNKSQNFKLFIKSELTTTLHFTLNVWFFFCFIDISTWRHEYNK